MPTAPAKPTTATKAAKPRAKSARKPAASSKSTSTKANAKSATKQTQNGTLQTASAFGDYAERAVLIPVGAALIARDRVVSSVSDTFSTYSTSAKAQAQLRKFERRGLTARKRLEREVRKARVRVERELRQRRKDIESTVNDTFSDLEARRESIAKSGNDLAGRVPEFANQVQERLLSLV